MAVGPWATPPAPGATALHRPLETRHRLQRGRAARGALAGADRLPRPARRTVPPERRWERRHRQGGHGFSPSEVSRGRHSAPPKSSRAAPKSRPTPAPLSPEPAAPGPAGPARPEPTGPAQPRPAPRRTPSPQEPRPARATATAAPPTAPAAPPHENAPHENAPRDTPHEPATPEPADPAPAARRERPENRPARGHGDKAERGAGRAPPPSAGRDSPRRLVAGDTRGKMKRHARAAFLNTRDSFASGAKTGSRRAVGDRRGAHKRRTANRHCPAAGYFARRRLRADSDSADPRRLKRALGREPWRPKAQNHSEPDARWTQEPEQQEQQEQQPDARNTQDLLPVAATIAPKRPDLARSR